MRAYRKDVIRTIIKGKKRFFAIMTITALGVCMLSGIKAGCDDLRYSADVFFDKQNLYDISIVSTMGLTEEDVAAVAELDGIEAAEGTYSEEVYTELADGSRKQAAVKVLSEKGINIPYLLEGNMPDTPVEILVTEKYRKESGKQVGDAVYIEEKNDTGDRNETNFVFKRYLISGVAVDVTDINSTEGTVAFRNNSAADYVFYVHKDAVISDMYTSMYVTLSGTDELACYSKAYEEKVDEAVTFLEEEIKEDREQVRYAKVTEDAQEEIADAEEEMWEAFAEAEEKIETAQEEIDAGKEKAENAEADLVNAERDLIKGERELEKGERELNRGEAEYAKGLAQYESGKGRLEAGETALNEAAAALDVSEKQLNETYAQLLAPVEEQIALRESEIAEAEASGAGPEETEALKAELAQLQSIKISMQEEKAKAQAELAVVRTEVEQKRAELERGRAELAAAKTELAEARSRLDTGWTDLEKGWKELADGEQKIFDGRAELEEAKQELADGRLTLEEQTAEFENEKTNALAELEEAKQELADLKMTEWYITTRTASSGYNNIKTDADCIEAIGNAFPVLFLTIAVLISLTTMSRMIEEDRGLIGTYKALGFTDAEIRRKYIVYALSACVLGGILGDILGYIVLPEILFIVFRVMYQLPVYWYTFDILYGIGGMILFAAGVAGAAYLSCNSVLNGMPAMLMRPKAPRIGSRVLLERVTPLWKKLSFLNKVTARNLFRYKKRLFMTLFGIAGCTSLLLAGFTIKDTVTELMPLQYEKIYRYDVMAVASDNEKLLEYLQENDAVRSYINTMVTNVKVIAENGKQETVQLIVIPDDEKISRYIRLYDKEGGRRKLTDEDVFATKNVSIVTDFDEEDFIMLQTMDLETADVEVTGIVMNYLGNSIYMTQSMYEACFDTAFEPNAAYILLNTAEEKQGEFAASLKGREGILSVAGKRDMIDGFDGAFQIINMVVYIIIVLAGALAFVVLFTLATTNISERERELATIKVLGFYDTEVHAYVNKETLILSGLGILFGMPLGRLFGIWLMSVLQMPSIYFQPSLYPESYVYAAAIAICFALLVNLITNKTLNRIDPVEALKSVE